MKSSFWRHVPGILWIAVIFILTCIPGSMIPEVPSFLDLFQPDKLVHLFLFTVLVFLLLLDFSLHFTTPQTYGFSVSIALNIGIFIGGTTELLQATSLVTGRHCSVYDFIANVAGCFLGWGVFVLWKKRRSNRNIRKNC
jgi:VanZ family protein